MPNCFPKLLYQFTFPPATHVCSCWSIFSPTLGIFSLHFCQSHCGFDLHFRVRMKLSIFSCIYWLCGFSPEWKCLFCLLSIFLPSCFNAGFPQSRPHGTLTCQLMHEKSLHVQLSYKMQHTLFSWTITRGTPILRALRSSVIWQSLTLFNLTFPKDTCPEKSFVPNIC